MTPPRVRELPLRLEPVSPDPFLFGLEETELPRVDTERANVDDPRRRRRTP